MSQSKFYCYCVFSRFESFFIKYFLPFCFPHIFPGKGKIRNTESYYTKRSKTKIQNLFFPTLFKNRTETSFWDEMHFAKNDEDHWSIHFFSSLFFKNQIDVLELEYKELKTVRIFLLVIL